MLRANSSLTYLDVSANAKVKDANVALLFDAITPEQSGVNHINVSDTDAGARTARTLRIWQQAKPAAIVDAEENPRLIGADRGLVLASRLKQNVHKETVHLSKIRNLGDEDAAAVVAALAVQPTVRTLRLTDLSLLQNPSFFLRVSSSFLSANPIFIRS